MWEEGKRAQSRNQQIARAIYKLQPPSFSFIAALLHHVPPFRHVPCTGTTVL
jgi:hypothetical protein